MRSLCSFRRWPLVMLASTALLLAACGDGEEDPVPDEDASETTEQPDEDVEDATEGSEGDEDDGAAEDEAAEDGAAEDGAAEDEAAAQEDEEAADDAGSLLEGLSFQPEPLRIDYEVEFDMPEAPDQMSIAQDGERVATWMEIQGMSGATFVDADEQVAVCFDDGSGWMCMDQDLGAQAPMDPAGDEVFDDLAGGELDPREVLQDPYSDTIAGREAVCGTTDDVGAGGDLCFDTATGMVLRIEIVDPDAAGMFMEAVEVTEATEEDLTPPAEPQSFGS